MDARREDSLPLVRIQSACFTAEIFRSLDCDCHEQLETSLKLISSEGGILIYILRDGRGAGIFPKVMGLNLGAVEGLDTAEAYDRLGIPRDPREYSKVVQVLSELQISSVRLLTNNPRKIKGLEKAGISVERVPLQIAPTSESRPYLNAKKSKLGHLFSHLDDA